MAALLMASYELHCAMQQRGWGARLAEVGRIGAGGRGYVVSLPEATKKKERLCKGG